MSVQSYNIDNMKQFISFQHATVENTDLFYLLNIAFTHCIRQRLKKIVDLISLFTYYFDLWERSSWLQDSDLINYEKTFSELWENYLIIMR